MLENILVVITAFTVWANVMGACIVAIAVAETMKAAPVLEDK